MFCPFCKKNGELESYYTSHKLRDENSQVCCPILKQYTCPKCQVTGDHTASYCPKSLADKIRLNSGASKKDANSRRSNGKLARKQNSSAKSESATQQQIHVRVHQQQQIGDRQPTQQIVIKNTMSFMSNCLLRQELTSKFERLIGSIKSYKQANLVKAQLELFFALIEE